MSLQHPLERSPWFAQFGLPKDFRATRLRGPSGEGPRYSEGPWSPKFGRTLGGTWIKKTSACKRCDPGDDSTKGRSSPFIQPWTPRYTSWSHLETKDAKEVNVGSLTKISRGGRSDGRKRALASQVHCERFKVPGKRLLPLSSLGSAFWTSKESTAKKPVRCTLSIGISDRDTWPKRASTVGYDSFYLRDLSPEMIEREDFAAASHVSRCFSHQNF